MMNCGRSIEINFLPGALSLSGQWRAVRYRSWSFMELHEGLAKDGIYILIYIYIPSWYLCARQNHKISQVYTLRTYLGLAAGRHGPRVEMQPFPGLTMVHPTTTMRPQTWPWDVVHGATWDAAPFLFITIGLEKDGIRFITYICIYIYTYVYH